MRDRDRRSVLEQVVQLLLCYFVALQRARRPLFAIIAAIETNPPTRFLFPLTLRLCQEIGGVGEECTLRARGKYKFISAVPVISL
jgi:hypothetical protein